MTQASFPHTVIQCLTAIAQHHGLQINPEKLIDDYALGEQEPAPAQLLRIASEHGLKAKIERLSWPDLIGQTGVFPIMARLSDGRGVIVVGVRSEGEGKVAVLDPLSDRASVVLFEREQFCRDWQGELVFVKRHHALSDPNQPFGLRWFIPEILKQKLAFRDIAITAVAMNLLGLASPIFFQLVVDKVLVHQNAPTLWVLAFGMVIALLFNSLFGFLRQHLTLSATNKIDMRLTRRTFAHMLSLPIDYFETTSAGVVARLMLQLDRIRGFLTGRLFFTALDFVTMLVFLPILFVYSVKLAMITLAFTLVIAGVVGVLVPIYRERLNDLNVAEGSRQALLVETIHGMRTVKALAIEPAQRRTWDQR